MKTAIIIPSRLSSNRVPQKAVRLINGKPLICHLVGYIQKHLPEIPVVLAVPPEEKTEYAKLRFEKPVEIFGGSELDPLERMSKCCEHYGIQTAVRVCHDKFLIDHVALENALMIAEADENDYLYSPDLIDGAGFEIISADLLKQASAEFENVEFISYAVRLLAKNPCRHKRVSKYSINPRLLIDFPEDVQMAELILSQTGDAASLDDVVSWLEKNPWAKDINRLPKITVYTCAYNAEAFLARAMSSVQRQTCFDICEYILIDDHSTDRTPEIMAKFAAENKNVKWVRNQKNLGLASSSNVALKAARGKYIIRLDADDFFVPLTAIEEMSARLESESVEIVYPDNYFGDYSRVQKGIDGNHVGGALFDKRALNFLKFTDGLRGYEGLDLFLRAKETLKIHYYEQPLFFYTQREGSMSKASPAERAVIKKSILESLCL